MEIAKQNILITGGASGVGNFLAIELSKVCEQVIVLDKTPVTFEQTNIKPYVCDLTNTTEIQAVVSQVFDKYPVSVLINNAGKIHSEPLINMLSREDKKHSIDRWNQTISLNLSTVFYTTVHAVEQMFAQRIKGVIINVSSISAAGNPGQSAYSAAKAGVNALTATWGQELPLFGIRAAGIAPGFLDTPSTHQSLNESIIKKLKKEIPLRKLGKLEDILKAARFIIENDYFNGRVLELDGGLRM
jgi:3-oxoacyl-[acyl-carrier protein] reductase